MRFFYSSSIFAVAIFFCVFLLILCNEGLYFSIFDNFQFFLSFHFLWDFLVNAPFLLLLCFFSVFSVDFVQLQPLFLCFLAIFCCCFVVFPFYFCNSVHLCYLNLGVRGKNWRYLQIVILLQWLSLIELIQVVNIALLWKVDKQSAM